MGDDLSTGAKIGIGLVILCFLIAIVLSLLMVVKNITNSGANQMEGGLNQMMQTTYTDYDQKVVSGTKVTAAVKLFEGENIAIVVNTHFGGNDSIYNYGLILKAGGALGPMAADTNDTYGDTCEIGSVGSWTSSSGDTVFGLRPDTVSYGATPSSPAKFNLNTRPMEASGFPTYVRSNAKYMAYLIKDSTETIIGIYFDQQT